VIITVDSHSHNLLSPSCSSSSGNECKALSSRQTFRA
jgi:hypothetical protein